MAIHSEGPRVVAPINSHIGLDIKFTQREYKGMEQANVIDQLGGSGAVAAALSLKNNRVSMWRDRGVPWRWRPRVAQLADEKGVTLPDGFLQPDGLA